MILCLYNAVLQISHYTSNIKEGKKNVFRSEEWSVFCCCVAICRRYTISLEGVLLVLGGTGEFNIVFMRLIISISIPQ